MIGVGTFSTTERMRELIDEVLDSGRLSYGPKSREFEKRFAAIHSTNHAVLSNSGTSALQVALQALKEIHGWNGGYVLVPAVTFVATANIVLHNNMIPMPVDVDPYTYNMDPQFIEDAITPSTRAIIPVHLFGQPAAMDDIMTIAKQHDLRVIEDSCECMFATHHGQAVGSIGDIGCFSTYVAHLITTGVGGVSITNNRQYAAKMRSLVNHGRDGIFFDANSREKTEKRFKFDSIGHSFRITELEAAIGLAQLDTWPDMITARRKNAAYLNESLQKLDDARLIRLPTLGEGNSHSWMMYPIVVMDDDKWGLVHHLEENGVETREMLPLINQPCYKGRWDESEYPVAAMINRSGFYVGCHQDLSEDDLDLIVDNIYDYFLG